MLKQLTIRFRMKPGGVNYRGLAAALLLAGVWGAVGLSPSARAEEAPAQFETGNRLYGQGDFKGAREAYREMVKSGPWSANLFYNLGNADYRLGDKGLAFLAYERALALDPAHPEARANLSLLRSETGARVETPSWKARAITWPQSVTKNHAAWIAALAFWGFCFCLAPLLWRGRAARLPAALCLLALGWSVAAVAWEQRRGAAWIVTGRQAQARMAPADSSKLAATLPMGSQVRILLERGEWLYVLLPDDSRAWIARNGVEPVALKPT